MGVTRITARAETKISRECDPAHTPRAGFNAIGNDPVVAGPNSRNANMALARADG